MSRPKLFLCFVFVAFSLARSFAATVDTVEVSSAAMNKKIKAVIITPADYANGKDYPVVYLLHGFGDNYAGWVQKAPAIKEDANALHLIIVCPDGSRSWYMDSPVDPAYQYETFVSSELGVLYG